MSSGNYEPEPEPAVEATPERMSAPMDEPAPAAPMPSNPYEGVDEELDMEQMESSIIANDDFDLSGYEDFTTMGGDDNEPIRAGAPLEAEEPVSASAPLADSIPEPEPDVIGEDAGDGLVVEEVMEEVNVYLRYGLQQKAEALIQEHLKRFPASEELKRALQRVKSGETAPVPASVAPEPAFNEPTVEAEKAVASTSASAPGAKTENELENLFADIKNSVKMSLKDEDYEAHYNMGIGYREMGMLDEAIEEFEVGAASPALMVNCYSMIAACHLDKNNFSGAIKAYKRCLSQDAITPEASMAIYFELGSVYERVGKFKEAMKLYNRVRKQNQSFRDVTSRMRRLKRKLAS